MPKLKIIAVGKIKEAYIQEGIDEFTKRLKPFCDLEIIELKDKGITEDSKAIEKYLSNNSFILDANGRKFSSEEFAEFIKKQDRQVTFIIGGPEGIAKEVKQKFNQISLSNMTFTHEMARLFLAEQLYRSFMIINNRSYYNK